MKLIYRLAYLLIAASTVAAVAGCAGGSAAQAPPEPSTIVVEAVPTTDEAGLYIAQDDGFFRDEGLNVTIVPTDGGELTLPDLRSGKAQLVVGNYVSFIQFQVEGKANLRIIANGSLMQPGNQAIYVMPRSPIHTVAELATSHATIGVNTLNNVGQVLIGSLLSSAGQSLSKVHLVVPQGGFPGMMQSLAAGKISAAWLPEPFGTEAEQDLGAVELADLDQGSLRNFPIGCYIGTKTWIQAHPSTVAAFLRALEKGQEIADTNREAVETALEKNIGIKPIVADTMTLNDYPLNMSVPLMQRVSDAMFEFQVMPPGFNYKSKPPYQIINMIQPEPGMVNP